VDADTARALHAAFLAFDDDPASHVAVFHGANGHFCAGWDLQSGARLHAQGVRGDALTHLQWPADAPDPLGPMGPSRLLLSKPVIAAVSGAAVAVGTVTLLAAILWRPLNRRVPAMLVAVVAGGLVAWVLQARSPALAVRTVEALPGAIPVFSMPDLHPSTLSALLVPSIAMTLLALAEAVSIAQALAKRRQEPLDGNQEFLGQGLANVVGSFFSSYPASGSFNRSGVNVAAGATTPFSAICASVFLLLILLFVAPLARYLPLPAVAAILFLVAWNLIDRREIRHLLADRHERITLLSTLIATLVMPLEWAILLGVAVARAVRTLGARRLP
jgi:SulP family sulfate permease